MPLQESFGLQRVEKPLHDAARQPHRRSEIAHRHAFLPAGDHVQELEPTRERLAAFEYLGPIIGHHYLLSNAISPDLSSGGPRWNFFDPRRTNGAIGGSGIPPQPLNFFPIEATNRAVR